MFTIKTIVFIACSVVTFFGFIQAKVCLNQPRCYCTVNNKTETTKIFCKNVVNVDSIQNLLKNFTLIYSLRIYGESLTNLTTNAFGTSTINVLEISAPVATVSEDALSSIKNLEIVNFNGSNFTTIPTGVALPSLRIIEMTNGSLVRIDVQLQDMNITTDFLLSKNQISYVFPTAFSNTKSMEYLDLSDNLITVLDLKLFHSVTVLKHLNLGYNQLETVHGLFDSLNPETIILYGNNLSSVDNAFHPHMWSMRRLDLGGNPNLNLTGTNFSMRYLISLNLNQNNFEELDPNLLRNFDYLRQLNLNDNNLERIPANFFAHSLYLSEIEVKNNKLKSIKDLVSNNSLEMINLKHVALAGNQIRSIDLDNSFKNVLHLDLSWNQIDHIRKTDFELLMSMTLLNLSGNPLTQIETGCLRYQAKLLNLDLSYSKITTFNHTLLNLSELTRLNAASSMLESIEETEMVGMKRLKYAYLNNNNLVSIDKAFKNNVNLTTLNIAKNNLTTLTADAFPGDNRKRSITWEKIWMAGNPWFCDCRLSWFVDWLKINHSKLEDEPTCQFPANLSGVPLRTLNHSILEFWEENCPEECICKCIAEGDTVLSTVDCTDRNISYQPQSFPNNAEVIDLSRNKLTSFIGFKTTQYERLKTLKISNNDLADLQLEEPASIIHLYLDGNNLTRIPFYEWNQTSFEKIALSRNPWKCDCETWKFRQWLLFHNLSIVDLAEVRCGANEKFNDEVIIHLNYADLCPDLPHHGKAVATAVTFLVCLLIICALIWCFRNILSAILYSSGCTFLKLEEQFEYPFDAFLIYADEDDEFSLGEIADELERNGNYNLFIPTRQVLLTTSPVNVNSSIADCCKVIVVLTSDLLRNTQCMQLLKTAMSYSMESSYRRFVFITKGKLPPEIKFDSVLDSVVKKSLHLRWGELLFWIKLKYHLPKKGKSRDREEESRQLLQQPNSI